MLYVVKLGDKYIKSGLKTKYPEYSWNQPKYTQEIKFYFDLTNSLNQAKIFRYLSQAKGMVTRARNVGIELEIYHLSNILELVIPTYYASKR